MSRVGDILPLELAGVSLTRGGKRVLKDLDLTLAAEPLRTLIIGPNGAGKSLLLKVAHGLVMPERGTVRWHGAGAARWAQAMVFQRPTLLRRSARANLAFALRARGVGRAERERRIDEILNRTGLARLAQAPARALSFGEQQRLALARALVLRPSVLFLDEPTANLDPAAGHLVEELINRARGEGIKVVMTCHDLNQVRRLADEVIFLHRGRIKERAPADSFFAGPENDLARAFLAGEPLWWRRRSIYDGIEEG